MLQKARWKWHATASISRARPSPQWTNIRQLRLASTTTTNDADVEAEERFDEHEYYEAAEDFDDELGRRNAGPARRNITAMGTVSVQNPDPSKIGDLISRIHPRNIGRATLPNTVPSILLLLLTPAMAHHALSNDLPLKVLQQFGENPTASKPLDAITAVVDRLPASGSTSRGEEGLGYHFTTSPGPLPTFTQAPLQSSTQKPGSLTFHLPKMPRWSNCEPAIQLPLAQTVFFTGLPSTMIHMRYEFDPLSGLLRKSASKHLEAQAVRVPFGSQDLRILLGTNLVPLTPLRRVVNSMGNIVRKVSDKVYRQDLPEKGQDWPSDELSTSQPASQELEAAVTDYFNLNKLPAEPVQVWALVVPRPTFEEFTWTVKNPKNGRANRSEFLQYSQTQLQDTWVPREAVPADRSVVSSRNISRELIKLIGKGARLCQVLSGGGGWGKKAGLISLDPDISYSTRDLRGESGWAFEFDDTEVEDSFNSQQRKALGDIVREGDGIMLFLARKNAEHQSFPQNTRTSRGSKSVAFGVVPSSIDEVGGFHPSESNGGMEQRIRHYPNEFGLLSEGGMAVTLTRDGETVTQTKLDVPLDHLVFSNVETNFEEASPETIERENGT